MIAFSSPRSDKVLGTVLINWSDVRAQPGFSLAGTYPLWESRFRPGGEPEKPISLHVAVSITPPFQGPYLLRTVPREKATVDDGAEFSRLEYDHLLGGQKGRWATRDVVDHAGRSVLVLRTR
jgi:hypothetical protein